MSFQSTRIEDSAMFCYEQSGGRSGPSLLMVLTSTESRKGRFRCDDCFSRLGVDAACLSALWIVSWAESLFGYPLMADAPEVNVLIAPKP